MKGILQLDWSNIKSAIIYGILWAILVILMKIHDAGSIFNLDWKALADAGAIALTASGITILKNLLTTEKGNFLGIAKVIPETK